MALETRNKIELNKELIKKIDHELAKYPEIGENLRLWLL